MGECLAGLFRGCMCCASLAFCEGAWRVEDVMAFLHTPFLSHPTSVKERDGGVGG